MQKNEWNILSTRPLKSEIIQKAASQNIYIDCISFIDTEPLQSEELSDKIIALAQQEITAVFTSMNAVYAVKSYLPFRPKWKIFCIGSATKDLVAATFGESNIQDTAGYGSDLAEKIIEQGIQQVYFFCGDQRREELPSKLKEKNIAVEEIVVYRTITTPHSLEKIYDGILFFSPSAVNSFFSVNTIPEEAILFAIGTTTGNAVRQLVRNKIIISDNPGKENLADRMMDYFNTAHKTIN
jgi:uroporphyrinogen-III synthase